MPLFGKKPETILMSVDKLVSMDVPRDWKHEPGDHITLLAPNDGGALVVSVYEPGSEPFPVDADRLILEAFARNSGLESPAFGREIGGFLTLQFELESSHCDAVSAAWDHAAVVASFWCDDVRNKARTDALTALASVRPFGA